MRAKSSKRKASPMQGEKIVADARTDSARLDALEVDVNALKGQVDTLNTRTQAMDRKLDQLLIREETKPKPHEPTYYISLILGALLITGTLLGAANWYIRSAIGEQVGATLSKHASESSILEYRLSRLEGAISWAPSLVQSYQLRNTQ